MKEMFNIAESGTGTYRVLAILRWVMVVIFVSFGMQKFTLQSAQGIEQFITNSPFISWLSVLGLRGQAYFLGVAEFAIAVLLWQARSTRFFQPWARFLAWLLSLSRGRFSLRHPAS